MNEPPDMGHAGNTAWCNQREIAEDRVSRMLGIDEIIAESAVDITLNVLVEPDRDMISAGINALEVAMLRRRPIDQRDLVTAIWRAMLDEARR